MLVVFSQIYQYLFQFCVKYQIHIDLGSSIKISIYLLHVSKYRLCKHILVLCELDMCFLYETFV